MSKTAIVWLFVYVSGLTGSFFVVEGPVIGLLVYMFTFYTQFSWAKRISAMLPWWPRWSLYAGTIILVCYLVQRNSQTKLPYMKMPQIKWLILIVINMLVSTFFATDVVASQAALIGFAKIVGLYYLIISIVRTKTHYKLFMWLQLWGNYLFGWQAFTSGDRIGGRLENIGAPGIKNANHLSNHILHILPFVGNWSLFGGKWERLAAIFAAPFIINAIILCNSRGAFLGMMAMALATILLAKKGLRLKLLLGIILGSILLVQLADQKFWNRMETIQDYEKEGASVERIVSWWAAVEMIGDYPLGKGGGGWDAYSPIYIPEIVERHGGEARTIHNTFLMMATDWGIQGLLLLLLFLGSTFWELHKMRNRLGTSDDRFYHSQSIAIEVSIIGFLVAAMFGNRIYAESLYWFCAIATALSNIQQSEIIQKNKAE